MSDGISDAYRWGRIENRFEDCYEKAIAEYILLKWEDTHKDKSVGDLLEELAQATHHFQIRSYDNSSWNSITGTETYRVCEVALEINHIGRKFTARTLMQAFKDALMFLEWATTEEGKEACKLYRDES